MRSRLSLAGTAVTVLTLAGAALAPAVGATTTPAVPVQRPTISGHLKISKIRSVAKRVQHGTETPSDVHYLNTHPKIARVIPDPSKTVVTVTAGSDDTHASAKPATFGVVVLPATSRHHRRNGGIGCYDWVHVRWWHKGWFGDTIYVWHHKIRFCRSRFRITRWAGNSDWVTNTQSLVKFRQLVRSSHGPHRRTSWEFRERHIQLCLPLNGCYANLYPHDKVWVKANGNHWNYWYAGDDA